MLDDGGVQQGLDLTIVTNMMTPYRLPLWQRLAEALPGGVGVVCLVENERNRSWGAWDEQPFPVRVLRGVSIRLTYERHVHIRFGITRAVRHWRPHTVLIGGWDAPSYWFALRAARRIGAQTVLLLESHEGSAREIPLFAAARRAFVRRVDGVFAAGAAADAYARDLGAPPARVFTIGDPVDVAAISRRAREYAGSDDGRHRRESLPRPVFAFVGQLVERKNVGALIDAFEQLRSGGSLLIAGDGPLRPEVERRAVRSDAISYVGSLTPVDVWGLLGIVDCLVLPSRVEVWGLVVNEALAAGAFCVVSDACGAAELIEPDRNGVVVKPDPDGIAHGLSLAAACVTAAGFDRAEVVATASAGDVGRTVDAVAAAIRRLDELGPVEPRRGRG